MNRALLAAAALFAASCRSGPCGTLTARAGVRMTSDPVEACGAEHDSVGLRFGELAELLVRWSEPGSAVDDAAILNPRPRVLFWTRALAAGSNLLAPVDLVGDAVLFDDGSGAERTLPLAHGSLDVVDALASGQSTAHLRWNLLFESSAGTVTAAGDDDVRFSDADPGARPTLEPGPLPDAGSMSAPDAGTACTREFGLAAAAEPTAARGPSLSQLSRQSAADGLCPQPGLAYLGLAELGASDFTSLAAVAVAFPGFQPGAAQLVSDAQRATFLACASQGQARALVRFTGAGTAGPLSFDACANLASTSTTSCPFASALPAPDANFAPSLTPGTSTVSLCAAGLRVSFPFTSSLLTTVGYAVEQPFARVQTVATATTGTGWQFDTCLSAPDLGAYHLQLIGAGGQRGPIECLSIR